MKEGNLTKENASSPQKTDEIRQAICTEECKEKLLRWLKREFWIVSVVIAVLGFFGIGVFIDWTIQKQMDNKVNWVDNKIRDLTRSVVNAELLADEAKKITEEARTQASVYTRTVSDFQQTLMASQNELDGLRQKIRVVLEEYANLSGETGHVKGIIAKDVNSVTVRLAGLEEFVRGLARETRGARPEALIVAYEAEVEKAARSEEEQKERFEENAKCRVRVYFNERTKALSDRVSDKLSKVGFKASSLDMARAKEGLWPFETRTPYTQEKTRQASDWLSDNIITYSNDLDVKKVYEVVDLIGSVGTVNNLKVLTWEFFAKRYGDPFLPQVSPSEFFKTSLIEVYLTSSN